MLKKFLLGLVLIIVVTFALIYSQQHLLKLVYVNPYTETSGFSHIATTIKQLDEIFAKTKATTKDDGYTVKYLYQNPYGSGFLKNNPIPNDLDYAIGIDLGTFDYNESNAVDIAEKIIETIKAYNYNLAINLQMCEFSFYATNSPLSVLAQSEKMAAANTSDIALFLKNTIEDKSYVKFTEFENIEGVSGDEKVKMPYIMNPNEILLQESKPFIIYSDTVSYNDNSYKYLREISIVPEFYATLNYNGQKYEIELIPEAFKGTRLQLSRRCFASTIFANNYSIKFLKNVHWLTDDDQYIKYRMLSYKRHLQEIKNLRAANKSPVKILKRIMQTTEIIHPQIEDADYEEYAAFVKNNLNNENIQLLNDYTNIYSNISNIYRFPKLWQSLHNIDKIQNMFTLIEEIQAKLEANNALDKKLLLSMKNFNKEINEKLATKAVYKEGEFDALFENYKLLEEDINKEIFKLFENPEKIDKFIKLNTDLLSKCGYHEVTLYWLNENEIGILRDDYTNTIKNLEDFRNTNGLPDMQYKLITQNQLPMIHLKFKIWAFDEANEQVKEANQKFIQAFLDDKKNFTIKSKLLRVK